MQTVTASAQGMVSQANKWREGKERARTPDWSSYVRRFSNLLLHIIPRDRFLHHSFDFQSGFNTTVDAISMSSHCGEQDDDDKTTQRQSRAAAAAAANRRPK